MLFGLILNRQSLFLDFSTRDALRLMLPECLLIFIFFRAVFTKGGFFSESAMCFSNLPISKKKLLSNVIGGKFKFQAQDSSLEYFFLRF